MKKTLAALALVALPSAAQTEWCNAQLEFRTDYIHETIGSEKYDAGIRGQYLNLKLNGNISRHFSYSYRQRFSKDMVRDGGFLNATDYLYLTYKPNERWSFSGGKEIITIGGYEYDYAPIDVYQYGTYCNQICPYGYGVSATFSPTKNDLILVQAAQSLFAMEDVHNSYGYNLAWYGHHGCFSSIYSIGLHETMKSYYLNVIALGNRFDFSHGHVIVDFTNRYDNVGKKTSDIPYKKGFFRDFTAATEVHIQPVKTLNLFARYAYEQNDKGFNNDFTCQPGTKQHHFGLGFEAFPLKGDQDVRLHAAYFHTWGDNTNPNETELQDGNNLLSIGLTFRINGNKIKERVKKERNDKKL